MVRPVAWLAEPDDPAGIAVVRVVRLHRLRPAALARLPHEHPAGDEHVGVRSAVRSLARVLWKVPVLGPVLAHVLRVARQAVGLPGASRGIIAATANFHETPMYHVRRRARRAFPFSSNHGATWNLGPRSGRHLERKHEVVATRPRIGNVPRITVRDAVTEGGTGVCPPRSGAVAMLAPAMGALADHELPPHVIEVHLRARMIHGQILRLRRPNAKGASGMAAATLP